MIRETHRQTQIFCFQIKRTPWMVQLMALFFPDCVIRVRSFCLTISNFFHIYYYGLVQLVFEKFAPAYLFQIALEIM